MHDWPRTWDFASATEISVSEVVLSNLTKSRASCDPLREEGAARTAGKIQSAARNCFILRSGAVVKDCMPVSSKRMILLATRCNLRSGLKESEEAVEVSGLVVVRARDVPLFIYLQTSGVPIQDTLSYAPIEVLEGLEDLFLPNMYVPLRAKFWRPQSCSQNSRAWAQNHASAITCALRSSLGRKLEGITEGQKLTASASPRSEALRTSSWSYR